MYLTSYVFLTWHTCLSGVYNMPSSTILFLQLSWISDLHSVSCSFWTVKITFIDQQITLLVWQVLFSSIISVFLKVYHHMCGWDSSDTNQAHVCIELKAHILSYHNILTWCYWKLSCNINIHYPEFIPWVWNICLLDIFFSVY